MNVRLITDSLGMERPPELGDVPFELAYPNLLRRRLKDSEIHVHSHCQRARTMDEALDQVAVLERGATDLLIVHVGVVDCALRVFTRQEREMVKRMPRNERERLLAHIKQHRREIILSTPPKVYTPLPQFKRCAEMLIGAAKKLGVAAICFINIIRPNAAREHRSPGLTRMVQDYNAVFTRLSSHDDVHVFDANGLVTESGDYDTFLNKDLVHLSREGGMLLAIKLHEFIVAMQPNVAARTTHAQ